MSAIEEASEVFGSKGMRFAKYPEKRTEKCLVLVGLAGAGCEKKEEN